MESTKGFFFVAQLRLVVCATIVWGFIHVRWFISPEASTIAGSWLDIQTYGPRLKMYFFRISSISQFCASCTVTLTII